MWNLDLHPVLPSRSPMWDFGVQVRRQRRTGLPLLLTFVTCATVLGGCSSILAEGAAAGAGVASASIAHGVTDNAAVVTGIGLGVQAAARAGVQFAERKVHQAEQDNVAATAGALPVGDVGHWQVAHDIPIEANEQGEVTVSRLLGGTGFPCKEIVFSVDHAGKDGVTREFYTATICRDGDKWKWATAEPATERWGSLQ
jgi:flavin-binding protein dodecin